MSIATLKKKTQTQYNNMSVGNKHGFSLNGTHRSQGYVGQTMLSRSLPRTLMKGHGGCCGNYYMAPVVLSAVTSLNDPNIIKPSVLGTDGMISTKYRWINRPQTYTTVKPDNNSHLNDQQDYITRLRKKTIAESNNCLINKNIIVNKKCPNIDGYFKHDVCNYTKDEGEFVAISEGEHLINIHNICTQNDIISVPTHQRNTPFACGIKN